MPPSPTVTATGVTLTRIPVFSTVTVYVFTDEVAVESSGVTTMLTAVDDWLERLTSVAPSVPLSVRDTAPPATVTVASGSLVVGVTSTLVVSWGTRTV